MDINTFTGSRTMPLTNDDTAELGLPGLIATVGTRTAMPSTKPRREKSLIRYSPIDFAVP